MRLFLNTIYYANTGEIEATNVVITDEIDANLTNIIPADGGSYNSITRTITWNIGAVPIGGSGYVHFLANVISSASNVDIYNRATINYDGGSRVTNQTVHHVGAPQLTITKTDSPDPVEAGANLIYTLTIGNTGNEVANNVVVNEAYDANVSFVSATPAPDATTNNQWTFASLAPGETKVITVTVKVGSPLVNGTILSNKAQVVSAETPTPVSVIEPTTVSSKPILNISKSIGNRTVVSKDVTNIGVITCTEIASGSTATVTSAETSGTTLTYIVSYSNTGNANATGVVLTDTVPAGATFVSASDGGTYDSVTGKVTWNIGTINAGVSGSVSMTVSLRDTQ